MAEAVLDLTQEEPDPAKREPARPRAGREYDPGPARERTRGYLAGGLTVLLGLIIVLAFLLVFTDEATVKQTKELLGVVLTPVIGLVGTVVGFYFGEKSARRAAGIGNSD